MGRKLQAAAKEYIIIGTIVISFLIFSLSRFQLPHYINILFPFFAILLAQYLYSVQGAATMRRIMWVQSGVNLLLQLLVIAVACWFGVSPLFLLLVLPCMLLFWLFRGTVKGGSKWQAGLQTIGRSRPRSLAGIVGSSFMVGILLYGFLNWFFYPPLLVFTTKPWLDSLLADGATVKPLRHFPHFHISQLTGRFINRQTRAEATEDYIVAEVRPEK